MDYLVYWVTERESIRKKKESGAQRPWSKDPLFKYRFCNVRREDDRVTKWIADEWRSPNANDPYLWFAMTFARLFNFPSTLAGVGYPSPWKSASVSSTLKRLRQRGKIFNSAYIVSTNGVSMDKVDYLIERVLDPLWTDRKKITDSIHEDCSLRNIHQVLTQYSGIGSFIGAQVVADVKYVEPYLQTEDWYTFAASGPGSRRGLNRLLGRDVNKSWPESLWHKTLLEQLDILEERIDFAKNNDYLHAQDFQNCLCEFDKYERVRTGQGTPKQFYTPAP